MANKGTFIRLTPEVEQKLEELITYFSNEVVRAEKGAVISAAIQLMHDKYISGGESDGVGLSGEK